MKWRKIKINNKILAVVFINVILIVSFFGCLAKITRDEACATSEIIIENVPYVCQKERLDCALTSRAMVLGSLIKGMTYPKSLYYSAQAYGFTYFPLWINPPGSWDDENNEWLASLYGLSYERVMPDRVVDPDKEWEEYINRIWEYLQQGSPVMVCRGWAKVLEEGGKIIAARGHGMRVFWWEGMNREARTQVHYITVVGMDRQKSIIYLHDPILGWIGEKGRYRQGKLARFREFIELTPRCHKYITKTFKNTGEHPKSEQEIESLVKERIIKKLKGNPSVYDKPEMWSSFFGIERVLKFEYGLNGLKAFRNDLEPESFKKVLRYRMSGRLKRPADLLSYLNLWIYHYTFLTSITAEHLEANGRLREWEWLFNLHLLYEKLWVSTTKLHSIFKSTEDLDQAINNSKPILKEMRGTIDEMSKHIQSYLKEFS